MSVSVSVSASVSVSWILPEVSVSESLLRGNPSLGTSLHRWFLSYQESNCVKITVFPSFKMDFVTEDCKPGGEGKQDFQRAPCRGVLARRGPDVGPVKEKISMDSQESYGKI